ncbi:MAG: tRNA lysidine(34) synthetase TilS [Chloroflexi bacterium RBG_16_50_9]|nr:MAG: tRNA lysidine(34) synthetase TilS [Chloroflexi bacterium RBG_16_50_9]
MPKQVRRKVPVAPECRVSSFIREQHLIPPGQKVLVAVSGGPDSVCLLHILLKLQNELNIKLHVAHLNHQLRGGDSDADAVYVAGLAHRLGLPAAIECRDVKAYQASHHASLEEAAREVRYAFLAQVAASVGAERVAVGHTLDDHVETILMHLIRGSGTRGLRGLQPVNRWWSGGAGLIVMRPLLELSREETMAYCRDNHLEPRLDASNLSLEPLRNKIRYRLLPQLKEYNPRVVDALLRTARIAGDDIACLGAEAARLRGEITRKEGETVIFDRPGFINLPAALKRHLLRTCIEELTGNLKDIEARHIEDLLNALGKPAGKKIILPDGLTFTTDYDRYLLGANPESLIPFPPMKDEAKLNIPGKVSIPGWDIKAIIASPSEVEGERSETNGLTARFDVTKTGGNLTVRHRLPGDRFQPLGMSQPKKINEFMIDAKIPQGWRQRIPMVCSPEHILWVVGWRIDERVKVSPDTKQVLRLEFNRH